MPLSEEAIRDEIAKALRCGRRRAGLSQGEVAGALGVTFQTVSKWENAIINIAAVDLLKLATLLQFSIDGMVAARVAPEERNLEVYRQL